MKTATASFILSLALYSVSAIPAKAEAIDDTLMLNHNERAGMMDIPALIYAQDQERRGESQERAVEQPVYVKREPHSFELRSPEDGYIYNLATSGSFEFRALDGGQSSQYYVGAFLQGSGTGKKSLFDRTLFDGYVVAKSISLAAADFPAGQYQLIAEEYDPSNVSSATITRSFTIQGEGATSGGSSQSSEETQSLVQSTSVPAETSSEAESSQTQQPKAQTTEQEQAIGAAIKQLLKGLDALGGGQ